MRRTSKRKIQPDSRPRLSPGFKPHPDWIKTRVDLFRQVRGEVMKRLGSEPEEIRQWSRVYEREFKKKWRVANKAELLNAIEASDIVYGGDFHALGQAQRTHLKILRAISDERPLILGLECFSIKSQRWLDLFSKGDLSLEALRVRTHWDTEWGFPWENYRPLLELARKRGFKLLALNSTNSAHSLQRNLVPITRDELEQREMRAAKRIREAYVGSPGSLLYVIFGDLHLAQAHLPAMVRSQMKRVNIHDLIVHLNSERLYFQLAQQGLELAVDVLRLSENQFCVMSSPPWVKWQSYLLFLEQQIDTDLDDETGDEFDPTDQVANLVRLVVRDLNLDRLLPGLALTKVDDVSIYAADDERIWKAIGRELKASDREAAKRLLASGRSFFLPGVQVGYLARSTVNHAASLAGLYIHAKLAQIKRPLFAMPRDFKALIWSEAVAFFFSKIVNHKRQSETIIDLRAQLAMSAAAVGRQDQGREAMRLALDTLMSEMIWIKQGRRRSSIFRPRLKSSYFDSSRILGGMLGERLYLAHRSRKLTNEELVRWLSTDVTDRSFAKVYERVLRRVSEVSEAAPDDLQPGDVAKGTRRTALTAVKSRKERL
jgi:hypothetical protein